MLPALSVSKSVSAYSPLSSSKLKMTSVVVALAVTSDSAITISGATFRLAGARSAVTLNAAMPSETSGHLRRVLGVGFGLAVCIGSTIGVGILRTPGIVAQQLHAPLAILLLWVAGGIYTLLGASC